MKYRKIGNTELNCSEIGFGSWVISGGDAWTDTDDQTSMQVLQKAYDEGINFFDAAPAYGMGHAEELLGKAIKPFRKDCIIATKCGIVWNDRGDVYRLLSKESIFREVEDSLRRMQTDYIDLYQVHWPDFQVPVNQTMEALMKLKEQGKIRYIGVCNTPVFEMDDMRRYGEIVSSQNLYNMIDRNSKYFNMDPLLYETEKEILPYCEKNGMGFIPYAPLCQGLLTGSFKRGQNFHKTDVRNVNRNLVGANLQKNLETVERVRQVADEIGHKMSQLAINYLLKKEVVTTVIAGSTKTEFLMDNIASLDWQLDNTTYEKLNCILAGSGLNSIE